MSWECELPKIAELKFGSRPRLDICRSWTFIVHARRQDTKQAAAIIGISKDNGRRDRKQHDRETGNECQ